MGWEKSYTVSDLDIIALAQGIQARSGLVVMAQEPGDSTDGGLTWTAPDTLEVCLDADPDASQESEVDASVADQGGSPS